MKYIYWFILCLICSNSFADELVKVQALNGKVSIVAPKDFGIMPDHILEVKYPLNRRPTEVLSDERGLVSLAFNHTQNAMKPSEVKNAHAELSKMFHNLYPSATWFRDELIEQNGSTFMVLELITPGIDTKIHNIIYGTSVDGRFLLVAFNTTIEKSEKWLPIGKNIMSSLSVK